MSLKSIRKRDGRVVPFEKEKIVNAIYKAAQAVGAETMQRPSGWRIRLSNWPATTTWTILI